MIAYKTNGDWTDVTSLGRNEIVFEGRNKEYGAFAVRQQYNSALLLSLFIAGSFGVLCAVVPAIWNYFHKTTSVIERVKHFTADPMGVHPFKPAVVPPPVTPPARAAAAPIKRPPPAIVTNTPIDPIPDTKKIIEHPGTDPGKDPGDMPIGDPNGDPNKKIIEDSKPIIEPPITIAQVMPTFKGELQKYFNDNVILPELERSENIQGTVYLTFVIEEDGSITNVTVLHGIAEGPGYTKEAIRLIESMPKWNPGMQNGHPVRVQFNLPVHFSYK